MADLLREYPILVGGTDEKAYVAQVWGREMPDRRWEVWVVFLPIEGGQARRTERDTTQATREAAAYWAAGVTAVYLEGALTRSAPLQIGSSAA
jgi:hypothetical protein